MRKLSLRLHGTVALAIVITFLCSCKKEISENYSPNIEVIKKINTWLDKQKTGLKQFKSENIDLLKKNLTYSNLRIEKSDAGEQIVIVPISEEFKQKKINDKGSIPNLVVILDRSDNVRWGSVILFKPDTPGVTKVSDNVFYNLFNTGNVNCNGQFQFLSPAGFWLFQLNYKDGALKSCGQIEQGSAPTTTARLNTICIDWYLVTSYYLDGILVYQTREYVGQTCSDDCNNGLYQSLCPDGGGGGGGSSSPSVQETISGEDSESESEPEDNELGPPAPLIDYRYPYQLYKLDGYVVGGIAYNTYITNSATEFYVDRYGRNTTRMLTLFGHWNNVTPLGLTGLIYHSCFVYARWYYGDGTSYSKQWLKTHTMVKSN